MRHMLGRSRSGEQGPTPSWFPVHPSLVPFVCGSVSGVWLSFLFPVLLSTKFIWLGHLLGSHLSLGRVSVLHSVLQLSYYFLTDFIVA